MDADELFGPYGNDLPLSGPSEFPVDDLQDVGVMSELVNIDLDEIDKYSAADAEQIVSGLAKYFFDEEYVAKHPYIKTKIKTELDIVRRTIKMLKTNEGAQDALINGISLDPTKAALFSSLTALQNAAGALHKQLSDHMEELENIFQKMEDDTERTFAVKDKDSEEDMQVVRGSKEFILKIKGETE